jgi:hypothetical protein
MGLDGERLVRCYHALDTITIGSAVYDYSAGPGPLSEDRLLQEPRDRWA